MDYVAWMYVAVLSAFGAVLYFVRWLWELTDEPVAGSTQPWSLSINTDSDQTSVQIDSIRVTGTGLEPWEWIRDDDNG